MRVVAFLLFAFVPVALAELDVVHLKTGESAACEVTAVTDNIVTFSLPTGGGPAGGSARRTLPMERVLHIEWGFESGEEEVFTNRAKLGEEILEKWWNDTFGNIGRPRSRTAAYGVALGNALLRSDSEGKHRRALSLFDLIVERAWSEEDISAAKQGRLRALMATGDLATAVEEAGALAATTEDPELLIEVKFLLAEADYERLRQLEQDNPRWPEDDEVRPERNRLYHRVLDQYLWPHLFHATHDEKAARGLVSAADVYRFSGDLERAEASYRDALALYPGTESAMKAETGLAELSAPEPENP